MLDPYDDKNRPVVGSLVRVCYGVGVTQDPRYAPGIILAAKGSAVSVKWAGVPDEETWNLCALDVLVV